MNFIRTLFRFGSWWPCASIFRRRSTVRRSPAAASRIRLAFVAAFFLAISLSPAAFGSYIRTGWTNVWTGLPLTNSFVMVHVGDIRADGGATPQGLPIRVTPAPDGLATNQLPAGNYYATNANSAQAFYFRAPQDSGPTVYSFTQPGVWISGGNYFVTLVITNGSGGGSVTFNNVTNALGFTPPMGNTLTNLIGTNGINSTNFTLSTGQGLTNLVYTNSINGTNLTLRIGQNDTNFALSIGLNSTNLTMATGQGLTNLVNTNGINGTNLTMRIGQNDTNFTLVTGLGLTNLVGTNGINSTNFTLATGQALTNAVNYAQTNASATNLFGPALAQVTNIASSVSGSGNSIANSGGKGTNTTIVTGISIATTNLAAVTSTNGSLQATNLTAVKFTTLNDADFNNNNISNISYILFNPASAHPGTIIAGIGAGNIITAAAGDAAIVMGRSNRLAGSSESSIILGGEFNILNPAKYAAIVGGLMNTNKGAEGAFIAAGVSNQVANSAAHSFASGSMANAAHADSFVVNDGSSGGFATTATNQALFHELNGLGINTNSPPVGGLGVSGPFNLNGQSLPQLNNLTNWANLSTNLLTPTNAAVLQAGGATNLNLIQTTSLGGNTNWMAQGPSIFSIISAASWRLIGTYIQISANGYTNLYALQHGIPGIGCSTNGANAFLNDNGTNNIASATTISGPWTVNSGPAGAPVSWIGASNQLAGIIGYGPGAIDTNLWNLLTNQAAIWANRATNTFASNSHFVNSLTNNEARGVTLNSNFSVATQPAGTIDLKATANILNGDPATINLSVVDFSGVGSSTINLLATNDSGGAASKINLNASGIESGGQITLSATGAISGDGVININSDEIRLTGPLDAGNDTFGGGISQGASSGNAVYQFTGAFYGNGGWISNIQGTNILGQIPKVSLTNAGTLWTNFGLLLAQRLTNYVNTNAINLSNDVFTVAMTASNFTMAQVGAITSVLTSANVTTNLNIAGVSQELLNTNVIVLRGSSNSPVNLVYYYSADGTWTNAGSGYGIALLPLTKYAVKDSSGNILFIRFTSPVGTWSPNLISTNPPTGDWGRISDHGPGGNAEPYILADIPASAISGTVLAASNAMYASSPFVILHTNSSVTIYTNGITGAPTTISFPASTTAGWNECQSLFHQSTNSPFAGFRLMIDPGLYKFTTQLIISNRCIIQGAGTAGTIFRYVGSTNFATMQNITNCLAGSSGDACAQRTAPYSLLYCSSNHQDSAGVENIGFHNINVSHLSIQASTNMFCFGVSISGGDFTRFEDVIVGGPEMWTKPSYYNEFMTGDQIPEPSKMIGFVIGGNQPKLDSCRVMAVADGVVVLGDSFLTINDFDAIALDYAGQDGASPYPATSELSLNTGILVPLVSQCEFLSVNHVLFFDCWNDFYIGTQVGVNITQLKDQNAPFIGNNIDIYKGNSYYATVQVSETVNAASVTVITNDADLGFYTDAGTSAYLVENIMTSDGVLNFYDSANTFLSASRNGIAWLGTVGNNIQAAAGKQFTGNGAGLTNLSPTAIVPVIIQTNVASGQLFTNNYGTGITVKGKVGNTVAAVNGSSDMAIRSIASPLKGGWTNDSAYGTTVGVTIAMTYTNTLSIFVPTNGIWCFTNLSSGVGNSATVLGAQIKYP